MCTMSHAQGERKWKVQLVKAYLPFSRNSILQRLICSPGGSSVRRARNGPQAEVRFEGRETILQVGIWRFILRSTIQTEVQAIRKPFEQFRDNRKSIPQHFKSSIRKNDYKKSRLISFLKLTTVQRSDLTVVFYAVPFSGSMQDDARRVNSL